MFVIGAWGAVNLLVGFGGNIVLARMLTPSDFGIVAVGATLMALATTLSDGGLGSGLIRRPERPTAQELRAVLALQLAFTGLLAALAAVVASFFGPSGFVVAVMLAGLPIAAVQTPGRVMLARTLRFRLLTGVDATGVLAYYVWAVAGVLAGFGVWALATGTIARAVASCVALAAVSRESIVRPSFRGARLLRPVIAFGVRFQAISFTGMIREQGLNAGVAAFSGVATLGLWTLAKRLLEIPTLIFEPLHRVSFPYMSQVNAAKEDVGPALERGMRVSGTAVGIVLTGLAAGATGLVPGVFGAQWRESAVAVQWVCVSLLVAAPLAVVAVGFLYAVGQPSVVLRATVWHTAALFAVTLPLLLVGGGVHAIGAGSLTGAVVDAIILGLAVSRLTSARPFRLLVAPLVLAIPAGVAGALVTRSLGDDFVAGVVGGLVGATGYFLLVAVFRRQTLADTSRLLGRSVRAGLARDTAPPAPQHVG